MALPDPTVSGIAAFRGEVFEADLRGVFAAFAVRRFALGSLVIFRATFFVTLRFVRFLAIHHLPCW